MDFDMIEGMSNEEIENMYDIYNNDILDYDGARSADCVCLTGSGPYVFGTKSRGGCGLQLAAYASCLRHCRSKGFTLDYFYALCYCASTGRSSYWSACKR